MSTFSLKSNIMDLFSNELSSGKTPLEAGKAVRKFCDDTCTTLIHNYLKQEYDDNDRFNSQIGEYIDDHKGYDEKTYEWFDVRYNIAGKWNDVLSEMKAPIYDYEYDIWEILKRVPADTKFRIKQTYTEETQNTILDILDPNPIVAGIVSTFPFHVNIRCL